MATKPGGGEDLVAEPLRKELFFCGFPYSQYIYFKLLVQIPKEAFSWFRSLKPRLFEGRFYVLLTAAIEYPFLLKILLNPL